MTDPRFHNPPLKRHPSLQPLSREHYNGLTLARQLREAALGDEAVRRRAAEQLAGAWAEELEAHFADEEFLVGPLVDPSDRARLVEEHRSLERHARMAMENPEAPSGEWLQQTGAMLERHIRWEERELFPAAERAGGEALDGMAAEVERIHRDRPGSRRRQEQ
ncbi:MAG: hemerythrin domain-containing protein [Phycisphaerales bacterium]|nr:hemerythrin domain-containing protein [Phycisphaerales bacterium]